ncbi:MAG: GPP34 family phosphoprotein [Dehalococcoidia bacterium]
MRTIAEELLLFALDDEKGTTVWSGAAALPYGLAGALLADLALRGNVALRQKQAVAVLDGTPTGDDILDDALAQIATSRTSRDTQQWVTRLTSKVKRLRDRLEDRLVAQGILRKDQHRVLFLFPFERLPTDDPTVERGLRDRVRAAILEDEAPDPRTAVLISLLQSCNLLDGLFAKREHAAIKGRITSVIESVPEGVQAGAAVRAATDEMTAATTVIAATS